MTLCSDDNFNLPHFPGSASLLNDLGKEVLVKLRGPKCYIGYLRAVDQFGNIILHDALERIFVGDKYADIKHGILLVRGENIALIGEQKPDFDIDSKFTRTSEEEIFRLRADHLAELKQASKRRAEILSSRGIAWLEPDSILDDV
ncbi:SM-like, degradation of cytoplasmic mRNAs and positively regulates transcription initiation [Sparganum proliferum]